jgi:two-component system, OmpR family, response regulator PrrA
VRILLAEDDPLLGEAIASHLAQVAHAVDWVRDGAAADAALRAQTFDLVVLDLGLPRMSGKDVLKHMRDRALATPVLIITAADAIADRVAGRDAGADDYLVKPFALAELTARLHALLRRRGDGGTGPAVVGDVVVDPRRHVATRGGRELTLTRREFELLEAFARHPGQVLSRDQLLEQVWGYTTDVETNVVDVFVGYLRRKLEADDEPRALRTVRGVGWVLRP